MCCVFFLFKKKNSGNEEYILCRHDDDCHFVELKNIRKMDPVEAIHPPGVRLHLLPISYPPF